MKKSYKWYGTSNVKSFCARGANFGSFEECRKSMSESALTKMQWNTEIEDFNDGCEEIGYQVKFKRDMVAHLSYGGSYSGISIFIVLDADENTANSELIDRMIHENIYSESDREMAYRQSLDDNLAIYAENQHFGWGE